MPPINLEKHGKPFLFFVLTSGLISTYRNFGKLNSVVRRACKNVNVIGLYNNDRGISVFFHFWVLLVSGNSLPKRRSLKAL